MSCETCSGKGYIHTTGHPSLPDGTEYVERCDECYQEGRVSWTDGQAAEYARLKESLIGMLDELCTHRAVEGWNTDDVEDMISRIQTSTPRCATPLVERA